LISASRIISTWSNWW